MISQNKNLIVFKLVVKWNTFIIVLSRKIFGMSNLKSRQVAIAISMKIFWAHLFETTLIRMLILIKSSIPHSSL